MAGQWDWECWLDCDVYAIIQLLLDWPFCVHCANVHQFREWLIRPNFRVAVFIYGDVKHRSDELFTTRIPSGIWSRLWALNTIKKLCSPKKWAKVHQHFFRGCYPLRPPIVPNFMEICQTSLEKSVKKRYLFGLSRHFLSRTETWLLESRLAACERRD